MISVADRECGQCRTVFRGDDARCPICNPFSMSTVVSRACLLCGNRADEPCLHDDAIELSWPDPRPTICLHYHEEEEQ